MSIELSVNQEKSLAEIRIDGSFNFERHQEFREILNSAKAYRNYDFCIDMANTEEMDSSALGMLLLLREALGGEDAKIRIVGSRSDVLEVLHMANFHKFFHIE